MSNLSKAIFETQLSIMKSILRLMEFKFGGRESEQYRYAKEQAMNYFYNNTKKLFEQLVSEGTVERCVCGANIRHGWTSCESCSGSGFRDRIKG